MYPAACFRRVWEFEDIYHVYTRICLEWSCKRDIREHTKVDDIEHPSFTTLRDCGKQLPVVADTHANNGLEGCTVVFDKLNTLLLLFPKFQMAVNGCCDEKVCSRFVRC